MSTPAPSGPIRSTLVDITKCIGCRACQVACKQWNDRDGESTMFDDALGFQNPAVLSAKTYTLISFHEMVNDKAQGGVDYALAIRLYLHCLSQTCTTAVPKKRH